jgi:hypothetical protein
MAFTKQFQGYQSDITRFLADLKTKNPGLEEGQRAGRARLWDKAPIDLDTQARSKESGVKQQPYVYQNKF